MKKRFFALLPIALVSMLVGCAEVDSANIRTSGFHIDINVTAKDDSTFLHSRLNTSSRFDADAIILSSGDELLSTMSGRTIALNRNANSSAYTGSFNEAGSGALLKVSLLRANGLNAPNSLVTVPEVFDITAPDNGDTFFSGDDITVTWTPGNPSRTIEVNYSYDCIIYDENGNTSRAPFGRSFDVVDSGIHTTPINTILNVFGTQHQFEPGVSCPMEITVTRKNTGMLDRAIAQGGEISAKREKSVLVNAIP